MNFKTQHWYGKGQIPLGPVPRNFLITFATRKLRGTGPNGIWT